jgi:hypothetical protein
MSAALSSLDRSAHSDSDSDSDLAALAELRGQWAAARAAAGHSASAVEATAPLAGGAEKGKQDAEQDVLMEQYTDLEACAEELAAQCTASTGGTKDAKKRVCEALEALKAGKKKRGGPAAVQHSG